MKEYFNQVIAPAADELAKLTGQPMIKRIDNGEIINMTECDHCDLIGDPRDMFWGDNQQPYCSIFCADQEGQTGIKEINE